MTGRLQGKTALISGGNRGIGRAIAQAFAAEGADLVLTARDADLLASVANALRREHGIRCATFMCDVTDEPSVQKMVEKAEADAPIDILVNNAGIYGVAASSISAATTSGACSRSTSTACCILRRPSCR